jgi:hypothetical protein
LDPGIIWCVLLIFVFQCADTYLTLAHIKRGGKELNPLMAHLIDVTPNLFVSLKLGFSFVGLFFLALHQNFPHVRKWIGALFGIFLAVAIYHVFLLVLAVMGQGTAGSALAGLVPCNAPCHSPALPMWRPSLTLA